MCHSHRSSRESPSTRRRAAQEAGPHPQFVNEAMKLGGVILICIAIWLLTGAGTFWPAWVILIGGLRLGFHAREVFGGDDNDPDADLADGPAPAEPSTPVDTWA